MAINVENKLYEFTCDMHIEMDDPDWACNKKLTLNLDNFPSEDDLLEYAKSKEFYYSGDLSGCLCGFHFMVLEEMGIIL